MTLRKRFSIQLSLAAVTISSGFVLDAIGVPAGAWFGWLVLSGLVVLMVATLFIPLTDPVTNEREK